MAGASTVSGFAWVTGTSVVVEGEEMGREIEGVMGVTTVLGLWAPSYCCLNPYGHEYHCSLEARELCTPPLLWDYVKSCQGQGMDIISANSAVLSSLPPLCVPIQGTSDIHTNVYVSGMLVYWAMEPLLSYECFTSCTLMHMCMLSRSVMSDFL